ncbi:MAG TPA: acyl-CoA dehydrogenase family protein [Candidatus Eremiobacteraeota bacterium]|nr:MAG: Acyl-CoA dehydrogenase [bacterium ADurb.Bin363]HPZ08470.1 acyl-CoA dehydrogenase family protein [Candidatus Eremiobacteraeota bacterium]
MDFSTSIKEEEYIVKVKQFINEKIKYSIDTWYKNEAFPVDILKSIYRAGLMGYTITGTKVEPEPMAHSIILYEKIAEVSPGFSTALLAHSQLGLYAIYRWGNIWQKQEFMFPGVRGEKLISFANTEENTGSDVANINLRGQKEKGGYLLTGEKLYITNGYDSDIILVTAVTDQKALEKKHGISIFIVDGKSEGLKRIKLRKTAMVPSNFGKLTFNNCFVPEGNILGEINMGFYTAMKVFNSSRIALSAMALGIALGAYKLALEHACERTVFGRPIFEHQAKSFEFAEKLTRLEGARLLIKKAAWMRDTGQKYILNSSIAKYYTGELVKEITNWAVEIFGASAMNTDNPINRYNADAQASAMLGGTSDIQKLIIARFMHMWDNWQ